MIYHLVTYIGMDALLKSATNQVALVASSTVTRCGEPELWAGLSGRNMKFTYKPVEASAPF